MTSFGGFSGFGQSNNQTSGFGFPSNTSSSTGFGSGGFGSNSNNNASSGSSLFGGGSTGGFSSGGGFGSTSNNSFGAKTTGFGSTATPSGTGLFGGNSGTSGSTGFAFGNNASTTTSGFSGGSGGGGLFGSGNKTGGFGSTTTTGGSMFGAGSSGASGGGFGSGTSTGFGSTATGLGGNVGDPPGTASVPFSAYQEKEPNGTAINVFQNLLFQDPYRKWSADELRLTDYVQGRKHGNASGAGAFGVSSGFGGSSFGANQTSSGFGSGTTGAGTSLFGSGSNSSGGFGSTNTNTTSGFGSGGGGLFGQNKPAPGGLFGNNAQSTTGSAFGSGGFGSTSATAGGFGPTNNAPGTGGGLFGSNAQQNKPSGFGGFGSGNTTSGFGSNSQTTGFASTSTTGGGLFGSNIQNNSSTSGNLFGNNQNQPSTTTGGFSSGFGSQNQQQNTGGLFGNNNQQKPGGLFGSTSTSTGTGGGLFGNASNTTSSGFGSNTTTSTGGGLFGNAAKPGTAGTGLFGSSTTAQNTGTSGGLFSQSNQNQQQNSGMFSNNQAKPSIFGGSTTQNTGSIFGSQSANQASSLFGSTATQQQPQQSTFGNSLFGTSQNQANQQQSLTTSINDVSAFGSTSLFANLGTNDVQNPGPLATPLTNKNKPRKSSILPMYKLNPASASRYATPQKRGGFGFSYSTYGTPGSASSVSSTPGGLNQNLLMGNTSRGLSKSMSTSSLRRSFNTEDTILNPGVFSAGNGQRYGSVKKLVINREMRSDLFSTPQKDKQTPESSKVPKKHVTFEEAGGSNGDAISTALIVADSQADSQADSRSAAPGGSNKTDKPAPEVQSPSEAAEIPPITVAAPAGSDPRPGTKWMKPRKEEIEKMSRAQRQAVEGFTVGRVNVGSVKFLPPVDLTDIDLDTLFQNIVLLETRSATVYPDPAKKPPVGKGLNVPAEIRLEQSWPRAKDKRTVDTTSESRVRKHVERLKRIPDTTFINYDKLTGVWTFRVEHFTTYGLEYDEESDTEVTNAVIDAPVIPTAVPAMDSEELSPNHTDPDDTFEFRAKRRVLPGAFDSDYQEELDTAMEASQPQSFLADRSAGSTSNALIPVETGNDVEMEDEYGVAEDTGVASPYPSSHLAVELQLSSPEQDRLSDVETPGGIMRARMRAIKDSATPMKVRVADGDDWMDMLQRTISPQKRDRVLLKSLNANENYPSLKETMAVPMMTKPPADGRGFATSIDLMNSLFEKAKVPPAEPPIGSRGFVKWPYKRQKKNFDEKDMNPTEQAFHQSMRPSWGLNGTIVFATTPRSLGRSSYRTPDKGGILSVMKGAISSEDRDVRMARFSSEPSAKALREQIRMTRCERDAKGIPTVRFTTTPPIKSFFQERDVYNPATVHEKLVWELASILFDDIEVPPNRKGQPGAESRLRREGVSQFWQSLVEDAASRCVSMAKSNEEKSVAALSGHRIPDACKHLLDGKNFHLATLISVIGTNHRAKADMAEQMKAWQDGKFLSEFTEPIRALYSLLAGEVHSCSGKEIGPVEDRIRPFLISERFGLDWKQAFGLRLWYASSSIEDVAVAINRFEADLEKGEACPRTWYSEQGIAPIWKDSELDKREDLLWGLFKLYANPNTDLEAVLRPENSQLSPLDYRLCWQLGRALVASGKLAFGAHAEEKADAATISYASQLSCEGSWVEATFVLLHLSNPDSRTLAIKEHLARHAASIGEEHSETFRSLVADFQIPHAWVWESKALYMRSVKKMPDLEVHYLLRASAFNDAHQTLIQRVAPQAIIERDYAALADLLSEFAGHEGRISNWRLGGEVYRDFIRLVSLQKRPDQISGEFVEKLLVGLSSMQTAQQGSSDMEQLAALTEMGSIVARIVIKGGMVREPSSILSLPLTEDGYLRYSMDMSLTYYSELMAGGATAGY